MSVTDLYTKKYPHASKIMSKEDFEGLVEVFRILSEWQREAENAKGGGKWTASSSTGCQIENKKKDIP